MGRYIDRLGSEHGGKRREFKPQVIGRRVTIATTATSHTDKVYVTVDNDPEPKERRLVDWRPGTSKSGSLVRVYPQRNDKGVIIDTDLGRPWLLW